MKYLRQIIAENKALKTLDWIKSNTNSMSHDDITSRDSSMKIDPNHDQPHHGVVDQISQMDPDPDKSHTQQLHKYWKQGDFKYEDRPHVNEVMKQFVDKKRELGNTTTTGGKRGSSINNFGSFHELVDHLDKHFNKTTEGTSDDFSHPDAPLVHDKDGAKAWHLKTEEAAKASRSCGIKGLKDNKWCTSRNDKDNMFDSYKDNLHLIKAKDGTHYQFHADSSQYADMSNKMHKPEDLIKKHPEMKGMEFLHDVRFSNRPTSELVKDRNFHRNIAIRGTNENITELLKRPDLHPNAHYHIAKHGTNENITELLKRPDLHPNTQYHIARDGTPEQVSKLLKRTNLHPDAQNYLARDGTPEHRTELLKRPDLDTYAQYHIAKHGTNEQKSALLNHPNLHSDVRKEINRLM